MDFDKEFANEYFSLVHSASGWVAIARDHEAYGKTAKETLEELEKKLTKRKPSGV